LSKIKSEVPGTIVFIFQPAEEGPPEGELGGAQEMVKQGVLDNPKADVVFGLHIKAEVPTGTIEYRPGGFMAAVNTLKIIITGKQAHGANPWLGIDPIVTSAEMINNLQTIVSRNVRITRNPAVVTVGSIHGGVRSNIIPESVEMLATVRTFSDSDEQLVLKRINEIVTKTAEMNHAKAEIISIENNHYPVTYNDPSLTEKMLPALNAATGNQVKLRDPETGAEDFSFYQKKVPGLFFFLGGLPAGLDPSKAAAHHTPDFMIDDSNLDVGMKAFCNLVFLYAKQNTGK
jgi:amidohydrolase